MNIKISNNIYTNGLRAEYTVSVINKWVINKSPNQDQSRGFEPKIGRQICNWGVK